MTKFTTLMIAASLALAASATASAADGDITLRVDRGSIMTSQGGDFASAQSGKVVLEGERLMVTEGASATVFYGNDCKREYTAPGVYVIERDCKRGAAYLNNRGFDWASTGIIAAGVGVGAAILANMDKSPGPPPRVIVPPPATPISQ